MKLERPLDVSPVQGRQEVLALCAGCEPNLVLALSNLKTCHAASLQLRCPPHLSAVGLGRPLTSSAISEPFTVPTLALGVTVESSILPASQSGEEEYSVDRRSLTMGQGFQLPGRLWISDRS